MRKINRLLSVIAAGGLLISLCSCAKKDDIRFGTGNTGGVYYAYGTALSEINDDITVKKTAGSQANLRLMDDGFVDMAIVQSDVLSEAVNGTEDFEEGSIDGVSAVAGLYMEAFQIIVPADSEIQTVADLDGKRVSVGEDGSGVAKNAEYILNSVGLNMDMLDIRNLTYSKSADALKSGDIDAFFAVLGTPSDVVTKLSEDMDIRILSLDDRTISYMTNLYGGYYETVIDAGTYKGQDEDVKTVGVKAVLVAADKTDSSSVKEVVTQIFENNDEIKKSVPFAEADAEFATQDIPCGFHEGAADYYDGLGISVRRK